MTALCVQEIPWSSSRGSGPATPFDLGPVSSVGPAFGLLEAAADMIPRGAVVLARKDPPNAVADTYFFRGAIALLPERVVLPAAISFRDNTANELQADFVILLGATDRYRNYRLLYKNRDGSIWRRP